MTEVLRTQTHTAQIFNPRSRAATQTTHTHHITDFGDATDSLDVI